MEGVSKPLSNPPPIFPLRHVHYIAVVVVVVRVGKERHINWSMMIPEKAAAPVTGTTLMITGLVPAASRQ